MNAETVIYDETPDIPDGTTEEGNRIYEELRARLNLSGGKITVFCHPHSPSPHLLEPEPFG